MSHNLAATDATGNVTLHRPSEVIAAFRARHPHLTPAERERLDAAIARQQTEELHGELLRGQPGTSGHGTMRIVTPAPEETPHHEES